ncbi:MAG: tetratricopeptide repeat protein [Capsulimonadales bacterium]|nr:tetratricopeptide repeat protein [Capsulimonadales bacterium]
MNQKNRKWVRWAGGLAATLFLVTCSWAGPLEDAEALYRQRDYRGALTLLEKAREETPNDPRVFAALGKTHRRLGNTEATKKAYDEVIRLDPRLNSIRDKQGFIRAYIALGGNPPQSATANVLIKPREEPTALLAALTEGNVYVAPSLRSDVDSAALEEAVRAVQPTVAKVAVVGALGGYPSREALAADLRRRLNLSEDAVVIVATPRGISGSSARLSNGQLETAFRRAGVDAAFARGGLTEATASAIRSVAGEAVSDRRADTGRGAGLLFLALAGIGGFVGYRYWKNKGETDRAREPLEERRQEVLKNLAYVDGYLDLLPAGADGEEAKRLRAAAYEKYSTATGLLQTAKTATDLDGAGPLLDDSLAMLIDCRKAIDRATGGTGVAMGLPETPSLDSDRSRAERFRRVEEIRSEAERRRLQADLEALPPEARGVSFFSGRPMPSDELVPVRIVIDGQTRTVMATREEAEQIRRGETPSVLAFRDENGRTVPWYEHRSYDPYRDYYGGTAGLLATGTLINVLTLSALLGPGLYGGYAPWGYHGYGWGMAAPPATWGGWGTTPVGGVGDGFGMPAPDHVGGMDFFGSNYNEQAGGFDSGSMDPSGFDAGGFDVGGGDFGGGDFGGGGDW